MNERSEFIILYFEAYRRGLYMEPLAPEKESPLLPLSHPLTHILFVISVVIKGVVGILETIASFIFFSTSAVTNLLITFAQNELGEDPNDFFANKINDALPYVTFH